MKENDRIFLFDKARNYNLSQIPQDQYPWIVWIDTDDIFRGGEKLRELAERGIKENIQAFYMRYIYKADIRDGKVHEIIIEHERERLVRNNGNFKWIAPIHETFIEQVPVRKEAIDVCDVLHFIEDKHMQDSLTRNLKNLELAIYQTEGKDPRHIYYLAKAYFDIVIQKGNNEYINKTIPLINMYLNGEHKSGWPGERAQAYLYLSEIYRRKGELNNTIKSLMNALIEEPSDPAIYLGLSSAYCLKKDWERALFWVRLGAKLPENNTTLVKNPRDLKGNTLEILFNVMLNMGKIDNAYAAAVKMKEIAPDDQQINDVFSFISNLRTKRDITKKIVELAQFLTYSGEARKVKALLDATPEISKNNPIFS